MTKKAFHNLSKLLLKLSFGYSISKNGHQFAMYLLLFCQVYTHLFPQKTIRYFSEKILSTELTATTI